MGWLQRQPGVLRIWATTDVDNQRSAAVLMRLGMLREGLLRMATVRPQLGPVPRDTLVFGWCRRPPA
jgi:RimJ/RimL family protein N-acetyltransferase